MEGRALKSGTRCNGIPAAMSGSFSHCINFDDEQISKGRWACIITSLVCKIRHEILYVLSDFGFAYF